MMPVVSIDNCVQKSVMLSHFYIGDLLGSEVECTLQKLVIVIALLFAPDPVEDLVVGV